MIKKSILITVFELIKLKLKIPRIRPIKGLHRPIKKGIKGSSYCWSRKSIIRKRILATLPNTPAVAAYTKEYKIRRLGLFLLIGLTKLSERLGDGSGEAEGGAEVTIFVYLI